MLTRILQVLLVILLSTTTEPAAAFNTYWRITGIREQNCLRTDAINYWFMATMHDCDGEPIAATSFAYYATGCPDPGDSWPVPQDRVAFQESPFFVTPDGLQIGSLIPGQNTCLLSDVPEMQVSCEDPVGACSNEYTACILDHLQRGPTGTVNSLASDFNTFMCAGTGLGEPQVGDGSWAYYFDSNKGLYSLRDTVNYPSESLTRYLSTAEGHCQENWNRGQYFGTRELRFSWDPGPELELRYGSSGPYVMTLGEGDGWYSVANEYLLGPVADTCEIYRTQCQQVHEVHCD